jgi:hypothetical protein
MRSDAPPNLVKLAVARAIKDTFDRGKWIELGLLTDTQGCCAALGGVILTMTDWSTRSSLYYSERNARMPSRRALGQENSGSPT